MKKRLQIMAGRVLLWTEPRRQEEKEVLGKCSLMVSCYMSSCLLFSFVPASSGHDFYAEFNSTDHRLPLRNAWK